jgi:hypothetical protein
MHAFQTSATVMLHRTVEVDIAPADIARFTR